MLRRGRTNPIRSRNTFSLNARVILAERLRVDDALRPCPSLLDGGMLRRTSHIP